MHRNHPAGRNRQRRPRDSRPGFARPSDRLEERSLWNGRQIPITQHTRRPLAGSPKRL
jgi:hypothetical protein